LGIGDWIESNLIGMSLLLTAFASAAEAAVISANPFRMKRMAREEVARAALVDSVLDREEWYLRA